VARIAAGRSATLSLPIFLKGVSAKKQRSRLLLSNRTNINIIVEADTTKIWDYHLNLNLAKLWLFLSLRLAADASLTRTSILVFLSVIRFSQQEDSILLLLVSR
jgi:hypothetical protein